MMDALITILIPIASALAWIAYAHPTGFKRIYWPLIWITGTAFLCVQTWSIAVTKTFAVLSPFIKDGSVNLASKVIAEINPNSFWFLLGYLALLFYFSALYWIHAILGKKHEL